MRKLLSYDEVFKILENSIAKDSAEKRFAIGALAARIHEEMVLWKRLSKFLEAMEQRELDAEDMDTYKMLSKKSESLTLLIVKSVKELDIKDKGSVKDLVDQLQSDWFNGDSNEEKQKSDAAAPSDN